MFTITTDKPRRLVRVTVSGFWQLEDVADFYRQEQDAVRSLGVAPGRHRLLVDVRAMKIQSQAVVEALQRVSDTAALKAERFAFLIAPGLIMQQVRRAVADREIGVFEDERAALDYIDQE